MKVLFLHGAIKNAGDFLIAHSSQELIKRLVPDCEIVSYWEGTKQEEIGKAMHGVSGVVFAGGPFFTHHIYPHDIPFVKDLSVIDLPMLNIGGGWYGANNAMKTVKNYEIDDTSLDLLRRIEASAGCLSCRDWFTANMLEFKGFRAEVHGCPAWYDPDYIDQTEIRQSDAVRRICISDPADVKYAEAAEALVLRLKKLYPSAEIKFVFHRGTWGPGEGKYGEKRRKGLEHVLVGNGITWVDISNSHEGFSVYDSCDLHVGFRVHAHIYNLSQRRESILLEEDGRGAGVNQALGLPGVHVYSEKRQMQPDVIRKIQNRIQPKVNPDLDDEVQMLLERNRYTDFLEYRQGFERMRMYYERMRTHIEKIKEW